MLTKLTHPIKDYEFWVDINEVSCMERNPPVKSDLILMPGQTAVGQVDPATTKLVLKSGRVVQCMETPEEVMEKHDDAINEINEAIADHLENKQEDKTASVK